MQYFDIFKMLGFLSYWTLIYCFFFAGENSISDQVKVVFIYPTGRHTHVAAFEHASLFSIFRLGRPEVKGRYVLKWIFDQAVSFLSEAGCPRYCEVCEKLPIR